MHLKKKFHPPLLSDLLYEIPVDVKIKLTFHNCYRDVSLFFTLFWFPLVCLGLLFTFLSGFLLYLRPSLFIFIFSLFPFTKFLVLFRILCVTYFFLKNLSKALFLVSITLSDCRCSYLYGLLKGLIRSLTFMIIHLSKLFTYLPILSLRSFTRNYVLCHSRNVHWFRTLYLSLFFSLIDRMILSLFTFQSILSSNLSRVSQERHPQLEGVRLHKYVIYNISQIDLLISNGTSQ